MKNENFVEYTRMKIRNQSIYIYEMNDKGEQNSYNPQIMMAQVKFSPFSSFRFIADGFCFIFVCLVFRWHVFK